MLTLRRTTAALFLTLLPLVEGSANLQASEPDATVAGARLLQVSGFMRPEAPVWMGAYRAPFIDRDDGMELVVPRLVNDLGGRRTLVQVVNHSASPANVTLEPRTMANVPVACGAPCSVAVSPDEAHLFDAGGLGLASGFAGHGRLHTDGWITATILEVASDAGGSDMALDLALSRDFPGMLAQSFADVPLTLPGPAGVGTASLLAYNPSPSTAIAVGGIVRPPLTVVAAAPVAIDDIVSLTLSPDPAGPRGLALDGGSDAYAAAESVIWSQGGRGAVGDSWSGTDLAVPLVLKGVNGRCSSISVMEEAGANTAVGLEARAEGAATPALSTTVALAANEVRTLDACSDPVFASLPAGFVGSVRLTVTTGSIAAASEVRNGAGSAVALFDASSGSQAFLSAPMVHHAWQPTAGSAVTLDSAIALMNVGGSDASVQVTYAGVDGNCAGSTYSHAVTTVPAGSMALLQQGASGGSSLPAGCSASAKIDATGGRLTAVVFDEAYGSGCEREETMPLGGRDDNFATSDGSEPAVPSTAIAALYGTGKDFDQIGPEAFLIHSFENLSLPGWAIKSARLDMRLRPEGGNPANDAVAVGAVKGGGWSPANPSLAIGFGLVPKAWTPVNYPSGAVIVVDLTTALGGGALAAMKAEDRLDVYIQDDTTVDYLRLTICYEEHCDEVREFEMGVEDQLGGGIDAGVPTPDSGLDKYLKSIYGKKYKGLMRNFDQPGVDSYLAHTFTGLKLPGHQIARAILHFGAKAQGGNPYNDGVWVGHVLGGLWKPSPIQQAFGAAWTTGSPYATFEIDIGATEPLVLANMNTLGSLDVYIQDDTAVDFLRLWVCYDRCDTFVAGDEDDFAAPGPATSPSDPLSFWVTQVEGWPSTMAQGFDAQSNNGYFAHTFTGLGRPGYRICAATLTARLQKLGGQFNNDGLIAGVVRPVYKNSTQWNKPNLQVAPLWGAGSPSTQTLVKDISNLGWLMDKDGRLDVRIQDDTAVDWITLEICYCPVHSDTGPDVPIGTSGVEVSSQLDSWPAARLADGSPETVWSSAVHREHLGAAEWAALTFLGPAELDSVILVPRVDPADDGVSLGFPKDFVLQYAVNEDGRTCDPRDTAFEADSNWTAVSTHYGFPQPTSDPVKFAFPPVRAQCLRVFGAELSQDDYANRYLQLADIQGLAGGAVLRVSGVTASSSLDRWPASHLADADPETVWSSQQHKEHLGGAEWAAVMLRSESGISRTLAMDSVYLTPRADPSNPAGSLGFPKDFVLQYSDDAEGRTCEPGRPEFGLDSNWLPAMTVYGARQPSGDGIQLRFREVQAGCVRFFGAELSQDDYGNRYMQLAEIQPLLGETPLPVASVATSSALGSWPASRLIDSDPTTAWSSSQHQEHLAESEWGALRLSAPQVIDSIRLVPRTDPADEAVSLGFPKDFVLQYSVDGEGTTCDATRPEFRQDSNWRPLVTRFGFDQPASVSIDFDFSPRVAGCVRILGTELSQDDYGNRYLQLAEMEARAADWQSPEPPER